MTDIEVLRQAVIDAARQAAEGNRCKCACIDCQAVDTAVTALDAAMRPDPWQLLREAATELEYFTPRDNDVLNRLDAALAWRREHPDE